MNEIQSIKIPNFETVSGKTISLKLSYQLFGLPLHKAPIVLVNHALTGNSNVSGGDGWWRDLIGENKAIDTDKYTVLSFNIPGNGYDGFIIDNYQDFIARDIANIFLEGLKLLGIEKLYALIGGSLGGGIAWEMAVIKPRITEHLIPVATDWKSTDWLIANCQIQEQFLVNSKNPVHDARMHAMLCYRTPKSFKERFQRTTNEDLQIFNVESWLLHHGKKLQERFQLSAYKLMNQLLKTIDVTKARDTNFKVLDTIQAKIHIVGVDSDLFFTADENRETQRQLALTHPNVTYHEINSVHGHDAFLIEYKQLERIVSSIFDCKKDKKKIKILKFGGKSLANGEGLNQVLSIVEEKVKQGDRLVLVVSARGNATDELKNILEKAASGKSYQQELNSFKAYQSALIPLAHFKDEFERLEQILSGVHLLGDYNDKVKDEVLAQGELLSIKVVSELLKERNIKAHPTDARSLLKTDENFGNAEPIPHLSKKNVLEHFSKYNGSTVNVVSGFIASNKKNETTTLGRNGSNYTASLLANYLDAEELQNFTHVNGIYTADPRWVKTAEKIEELSFSDANEMASFGANILHSKTIIPLVEKNIPLRILNTFDSKDQGTLIKALSHSEGITSISTLDDVALLNIEGRGLLGKVGVDARIFSVLERKGISVSIVSQGSSERGIGLVVPAIKAEKAVQSLREEFEKDFNSKDINNIEVNYDVAVISIIGQHLKDFHKPFNTLIKNHVVPLLFNNTVTGRNVSLVVQKSQLYKAINVIHGEIFGVVKKVNLAIFGHGLVGGTLIDQIISSSEEIKKKRGVQLNIFAIVNSKKVILDDNGIDGNWRDLIKNGNEYTLEDIVAFANENHLENLIAIDNTASVDFVSNYSDLISKGFDLVSSNKIANTIGLDYYQKLRVQLKKYQKRYLYETNVGAGLPLIDTIKLLHLSGENITRIRGVFSGSLSYLFNTFSEVDKPFSEVLQEAVDKGFTEPDPREDLCGNDVARKLLILARELDLHNELQDVQVQNLISEDLREVDLQKFLGSFSEMNSDFQTIKENQSKNYVLRYVGDLFGELSNENGAELSVSLVSVPKESPLGALKGSDSIFEIYTESYGKQPLVIQGAGAGAAVTARGVFGDILRLVETNIEI